MLGAIIGDVAGSFREFGSSKHPELPMLPDAKDIPYRKDESKQLKYGVTDDTILTVATADACLALVDDRQGFRSFADFIMPMAQSTEVQSVDLAGVLYAG